jgi:predicted DNA-binding transcriptional regulator AlpA
MDTTTENLRLLDIAALAHKLSRSRSWIYGAQASGRLPKPLKINGQNLWVEAEIDGWIRETIEAARAVSA